jgi:hypothetical protein
MLTPVRAASNASFSSQSQTAAIVAGGLGNSVNAPAPVQQIEGSDLNSAIAGKLNILLLAVRARMVDALLDVLDTASRSISLPRKVNETNLAFASRLADVIRQLPTAKVNELERQFADQGHNLPLRLIAEALKNPAGPEAARVAFYLETVRYKDRDLAAGAVVRSYGQNDASPMPSEQQRPEIMHHEDSRTAVFRSESAPVNQPLKAEIAVKDAGVLLADLIDELAVQPDEIIDIATVKMQAEEQPHAAPVTIKNTGPEEASSGEIAARVPVETEDQKASPAVAGNAAAETPVIETPQPATEIDPIIPKNWTGIPASLTEAASEFIVAIIREQETDVLLEAVAVDPAIEIDIILDEAVIDAIPDIFAEQPAKAVMPEMALQPAPSVRAQQVEVAMTATLPRAVPQTEPQSPVPADEVAATSFAPALTRLPDGMPYATQPYLFAKDSMKDPEMEEARRQDQQSEEQPDEQQAQSDQDETEAETQAEITGDASAEETASQPDMLLLPAPGLAMAPVGDSAYALYQRMVGWE